MSLVVTDQEPEDGATPAEEPAKRNKGAREEGVKGEQSSTAPELPAVDSESWRWKAVHAVHPFTISALAVYRRGSYIEQCLLLV